VQGNYIGLDKNGTARLGNSSAGVFIASSFDPSGVRSPDLASDNTIGGTTTAARNVISRNSSRGVIIVSDPATGNLVQGNFIGTNAAGTASVGNSGEGVLVTASPQSAVGGTTRGAGNLISGNSGIGISLGRVFLSRIGGTGTLIESNFIGTDISGTNPLSNGQAVVFGQDGIFVEVESLVHTLRNNLIAFNNGNGVNIPNVSSSPGTPAFRISILGNAIFSNAGLGINPGEAGVTQNDNQDTDGGANELQNFPVLDSAVLSTVSSPASGSVTAASLTTINGTVNSTPNASFTLQFFFGSSCQGSGRQLTGSIPLLLGDQPVTTDSNGNVQFSFTFDFPAGFSSGFVNSTATSATGNTSEFSECIAVRIVEALSISSAARNKKQLIVSGTGFVVGAELRVNGQKQKKVFVDSSTSVRAKKAGNIIQPGDQLRVINPDGAASNIYIYQP
jgi:trimeric autotransporter adhesin